MWSDNNHNESDKLQTTKKGLQRRSFSIDILENNITVFTFDGLSREILIQFSDYLRAKQDQWEPPLRLLVDTRGAGLPNRYMIDRIPEVLSEIDLPTQTKMAAITDDTPNARFTLMALEAWQESVPEMEFFINFDPAMRWLTE